MNPYFDKCILCLKDVQVFEHGESRVFVKTFMQKFEIGLHGLNPESDTTMIFKDCGGYFS